MRDKAYETRIDNMEEKWVAARDSGNRAEAERLVRQILPQLRKDDYRLGWYRTYLCKYLLYRGELDKARVGYLQLRSMGGVEEASAYAGLARIATERADFVMSLQWVQRYENAFGSGCGNCIEGRSKHARILRTVWQAASQVAPEKALCSIIAGNFRPLPGSIYKEDGGWQRKLAAQEARLILAEHLVRQRRIPEAKTLFLELMTKVPKEDRLEDDGLILAKEHLKRLELRQSGVTYG